MFGCGLGTSDARSDKLIFTAESAQINLLVEEGLFGFIALVQMYLTLGGKKISKMYTHEYIDLNTMQRGIKLNGKFIGNIKEDNEEKKKEH